ncbi:MAG: hypothetical protein M0030_22635, partial [Actinomycetota bacterium]|nr:hypothetical protein [Actinomycetota bacterium]
RAGRPEVPGGVAGMARVGCRDGQGGLPGWRAGRGGARAGVARGPGWRAGRGGSERQAGPDLGPGPPG